MSTPEQSTVRWGLIGCGQIASDKVMPGLATARNADLIAFADPDPASRERAQTAHPDATGYDRTEDLLADERIEAVYLATPNHLHAEQTIAAARAGKHVLVEKPMALDAADGRRMVEAADEAGVKLMVAYMTLFNPAYEAAKRAVDAGLLGEIVAVRGRHSYPMAPDRISPRGLWRLDPRHGGGPLMDVGVYSIFTLRDLTGLRTKQVAATGTTRRLHGKAEYDSVLFTFLLADGTPGVIEANFTYLSSHIELEGTLGRLSLVGHITQLVEGRLDVERWLPGQRKAAERVVHEVVPEGLPHFFNYLAEVEHFGACIVQDREPISSGRKAVADLLVADAVRESIRTGRRVNVQA